MSNIDRDRTVLAGPEDTRSEFTRGADVPMAGLEFEQQLFSGSRPMDVETFEALAGHVETRVCAEASAQTFEVNSGHPFAKGEEQACVDEILAQHSDVMKGAMDLCLMASPFAVFPTTNYQTLCENIHPRPRSQTFLKFFTEKKPERARYFTTVSGIQSSHSPASPGAALRYYSRLAHLTPLIATALSTTPPYAFDDNDQFTAIKNNLAHKRRLDACGIEGAFAPALWDAKDWSEEEGRKFMEAYNDLIWDTPLFCHIDPDTGCETLFNDMAMHSLRELPPEMHTRANFNLASSVQYQLISISALPPGVPGRRVETRFIDNGDNYQVKSLAGLTFALAFDEEFGAATDAFLKSAGYSPERPGDSKGLLLRDVERLCYDYSSLHTLTFGKLDMHLAAKRLSRTLDKFCDRYPLLQPLTKALAKGETPALHFRKEFPDPEFFCTEFHAQRLGKHPFKPTQGQKLALS
ncbi:MAG: hypothetical protein H6868_02105 [Rhodospirillales bacterium]|nr:hypothetical protein [Rhodospirillales bacterium]